MNRQKAGLLRAGFVAGAGLLIAPVAAAGPWLEFDEFDPIIEINATDGDVGFHVLLDGEAWKLAKVYDADGDRMLLAWGTDDLHEQGITELFMESAEPLCNPEDAEDGELVVTLEEFLDRFEAGRYRAVGRTIDGQRLRARGEFTHEIPAAPLVDYAVEMDGDDVEVTLSWQVGVDLGRCAFPDFITPPGEVEVVRWEAVLEPNVDELPGGELPDGVPFSKFTIQLPAGVTSVEVPEEFVNTYVAAGVTLFKGEVGAKEESGNQTFTEFELDVAQ